MGAVQSIDDSSHKFNKNTNHQNDIHTDGAADTNNNNYYDGKDDEDNDDNEEVYK